MPKYIILLCPYLLINDAVNKEGKSREIGQKTYRSKEGPTGKTQNTIEWSNDMQECFDSKRND